jgi:microcystin-dependent protein
MGQFSDPSFKPQPGWVSQEMADDLNSLAQDVATRSRFGTNPMSNIWAPSGGYCVTSDQVNAVRAGSMTHYPDDETLTDDKPVMISPTPWKRVHISIAQIWHVAGFNIPTYGRRFQLTNAGPGYLSLLGTGGLNFFDPTVQPDVSMWIYNVPTAVDTDTYQGFYIRPRQTVLMYYDNESFNPGRWIALSKPDVVNPGTVTLAAYDLQTSTGNGWLRCNGNLYAAKQFPSLYRRIGTTFNDAGDPANTFRVPDYRSRTPAGLISPSVFWRGVGVEGLEADAAWVGSHDHSDTQMGYTVEDVQAGADQFRVSDNVSTGALNFDTTDALSGSTSIPLMGPWLALPCFIKT